MAEATAAKSFSEPCTDRDCRAATATASRARRDVNSLGAKKSTQPTEGPDSAGQRLRQVRRMPQPPSLTLLLLLLLLLVSPIETKLDRRAWAAESAASVQLSANRNASTTSSDEKEEEKVVVVAASVVAVAEEAVSLACVPLCNADARGGVGVTGDRNVDGDDDDDESKGWSVATVVVVSALFASRCASLTGDGMLISVTANAVRTSRPTTQEDPKGSGGDDDSGDGDDENEEARSWPLTVSATMIQRKDAL
mmetsp:Transcript_69564/g.130895  ORF Transcript_69564/g.130895 Transcript_69564/m.130895 type:complete len:252 (-) Transcript_69564:1459-2214(-)